MMDTMTWAILKMVLALGAVCMVLFFMAKLLKRTGVKRDWPLDSGIRLLATQSIAPRHFIALVEIGGEVLALGISETQITFLTKIENKEFVGKMMGDRGARAEPLSFLRYFHSLPLRPRGPRTGLGFLRRLHGR
jgi:flagellar biogenesis protein FliO